MVITGHRIETSQGETRSEPVRSILVVRIKASAHPITLVFSPPSHLVLFRAEMNQRVRKQRNHPLQLSVVKEEEIGREAE